jgi:hypothetical protein
VRRWNNYKIVPQVNQQDVGRPLAASETQCAQVLKPRKLGNRCMALPAKPASASTPFAWTSVAAASTGTDD